MWHVSSTLLNSQHSNALLGSNWFLKKLAEGEVEMQKENQQEALDSPRAPVQCSSTSTWNKNNDRNRYTLTENYKWIITCYY